MKFDFKQSVSVSVFLVLLIVVATATDVVTGISGLYAFALTPHGLAVIQVCLVLAVGFLLLRSFLVHR
jgi:hypothetical protein